MITREQVERIKALPRRQQGPSIDAAITSLTLSGRSKGEAIKEVAEALGMKPGTVSVSHYRRQKMANGATTNGAGAEAFPGATRVKKSVDRWAAFELLINEMVEERVQARLAEVRKVLG